MNKVKRFLYEKVTRPLRRARFVNKCDRQRVKKGFCDRDLWSFDHYHALLLSTALKELEQNPMVGESIQEILPEMIEGFEFYHQNLFNFDPEIQDELNEKLAKSFALFQEYYSDLWT